MITLENKTFYTTKEVMKILGVSKNTLYNMINENYFPVIKHKRTIRIPRIAFDKWVAGYNQDSFITNNNFLNNTNNEKLESLKNHILLIDNMIINLKLIKNDLEKLYK